MMCLHQSSLVPPLCESDALPADSLVRADKLYPYDHDTSHRPGHRIEDMGQRRLYRSS